MNVTPTGPAARFAAAFDAIEPSLTSDSPTGYGGVMNVTPTGCAARFAAAFDAILWVDREGYLDIIIVCFVVVFGCVEVAVLFVI